MSDHTVIILLAVFWGVSMILTCLAIGDLETRIRELEREISLIRGTTRVRPVA